MKKRLFLCILICVSAILLLLVYLKMNFYGIFVIGCIINRKTGVICPTCNFTDLLQYALKLDFKNAFLSNQYMFITLPFWCMVAMYYLIYYVKTGRFANDKKVNILTIILVITGVIFSVLRNV